MEPHAPLPTSGHFLSPEVITSCEICGHDYGQGVEVVAYGQAQRFYSFACAISEGWPQGAHCQRRIVGRGPGAPGSTFCCDRCAISPLSVRRASLVGMASELTN